VSPGFVEDKGHCLSNGKMETVEYDPKDEIEKGISAVHWQLAGRLRPISASRIAAAPELIDYLGKRNIAISPPTSTPSTQDAQAEQVRQSVMAKLKKHGKGIVLMHDFQHATRKQQWICSRISRPQVTSGLHEAEVSVTTSPPMTT